MTIARISRLGRKVAANLRFARERSARASLPDDALLLTVQSYLTHRDYLALCTAFTLGGFNTVVSLKGLAGVLALLRYDFTLLNALSAVRFVFGRPAKPGASCLATDTVAVARPAYGWQRVFLLNFDISGFSASPGLLMPYPMHPTIYLQYKHHLCLQEFRRQPKTVRCLFAGNSGRGYGKGRLFEQLSFPSRTDVVAAFRAHPDVRPLLTAGEVEQAFAGGVKNSFLIDSDIARIKGHEWLGRLASSDFFLCPPGIHMPMCHNAVEALAVGTVPLICYPDWFEPVLQDGVNCLAFRTVSELCVVLDRAMAMTDDEVARLREGAVRFYDEHLNHAAVLPGWRSSSERMVHVKVYAEMQADLRRIAKEVGS